MIEDGLLRHDGDGPKDTRACFGVRWGEYQDVMHVHFNDKDAPGDEEERKEWIMERLPPRGDIEVSQIWAVSYDCWDDDERTWVEYDE